MDISEITPISKRTDGREMATAAFRDLLTLLETLDAADWQRHTECPAWTVADMAGHVIGAAKSGASIREAIRQQTWGMRHKKDYDSNPLDATNDLQVRDHAGLTSEQRVEELRRVAPKAVRGRFRLPALMRPVAIPIAGTGSTAGFPSKLTMAHLMDVVLTRDVWMHRVDIARATGRELALTAETDGRIVEDVVAEWARQHQEPFSLVLDGAAGGKFTAGADGPRIEMDAIEFCRVLSGRARGDGLLEAKVFF